MVLTSKLLDRLTDATELVKVSSTKQGVHTIRDVLVEAAGGIDDLKYMGGTDTENGCAIDPIEAIYCISDVRRTISYVRGLVEAVNDISAKFGRPARVLEIGSGPLAPISLAAASVTSSDKMLFGVVDIHEPSLDKVRNCVRSLALEDRFFAAERRDAAKDSLSDLRPDIVVLETMNAGLTDETQTAITYNLGRQFEKGEVLLLPQVVVVKACLGRQELGEILKLDEEFMERAKSQKLRKLGSMIRTFELPHKVVPYKGVEVKIVTEVAVYGSHVIAPDRSDITETVSLSYPASEDGKSVTVYWA